jgi:hypothetical protein
MPTGDNHSSFSLWLEDDAKDADPSSSPLYYPKYVSMNALTKNVPDDKSETRGETPESKGLTYLAYAAVP